MRNSQTPQSKNRTPYGISGKQHLLLITSGLLLCLAAATALFTSAAFGQSCQLTVDDDLSRFRSRVRDANGLIHVTVNFSGGSEGSPDGPMLQAMQAAINEWNSFQSKTKVVFSAPSVGSTNLEFAYTTNRSEAGGCAHFNPNLSRIYWGEDLKARMQSLGQAEVTVVLKHELGHFLGLAHTTTTATIMD
jgi:hypothetical protein